MANAAGKTLVGFGFGPIQSGLFLYEAARSGNFSRYVVAEIDGELVKAVRDSGGIYTLNIACADRIERVSVGGVELYNPREPADREAVIAAIGQADEMATALPSVNFFDSPEPWCVARMLADGLSRRKAKKQAIIYAAENHNRAAEILVEDIQRHAPGAMENVQALNTVIGKMSGVIADEDMRRRIGLVTMTPRTPRAILVEEFNRILISRITLPGFRRGIEVFVEKDDLLPFEEAKLHGHNAIHAMIGFLADLKGLTTMAEAARDQSIMGPARAAFLDEAGSALIRRHAPLHDPLFTVDGFRAFGEDLLDRMTRPYLNDLVARVIRDPMRKLGYEDRLYGTMHLALEYGIRPVNLARGAAAAVLSLIKHRAQIKEPMPPLPTSEEDLTAEDLRRVLGHIWEGKTDEHAEALIELTWRAIEARRGGGW